MSAPEPLQEPANPAADPATDAPVPNQFALLKTRRFLPLFLVQFLGAFNDQVYKNAFVALLTYRLADQLSMSLSNLNLIAAALFILPFALFAPTAGQIADGMDKARMMRWVKLSELLIMCVAVVAYQIQNVFLLYVVLFMMGAQSAAFAPIKYAVLPQYLRPRELIGGNGLVQAATFIAILLGTIAGFQLILTEMGVTIVCIAVISVALVGLAAAFYTPSAPPPPGEKPVVDWVFPRAMWRLVNACRDVPSAMMSVYAIAWFWFVGATFMALLPPFAKEVLQVNEDMTTVLLGAFSVGVALGALVVEKAANGEVSVDLAPLGALGIAIFSALLWIVTPAPVEGRELRGALEFLGGFEGIAVMITFVGLAASAGLYVTPMNAVLQREAPDHRRSQFIACSNVVDSACMVFSAALAAALGAAGLSPIGVMGVVGLTALPMAFAVARYAPMTALGRVALRLFPRVMG